MPIYYEQQLLIEQAKHDRKMQEAFNELSSRKLYPSEEQMLKEAIDDLKQMRQELQSEAEEREKKHNSYSNSSRYTTKAYSTKQRLYEIKSAISPMSQHMFEQEYEKVLRERGEEKANMMVEWYHDRLQRGIVGF